MGWEGASMSILRWGGGGCCKSVVRSVSLGWESQCTHLVYPKFVMSNYFNVWGPLANESIPLKHAERGGEGQGRKSEGVMWT